MSGSPIVRSPPQASTVFGGSGQQPRQRNVFLIRFIQGTGGGTLGGLTYVVKHIDRPKIAPRTEELNQYNKKRLVYTGFKYEPIRATFYDSADGSAQDMWANYARSYFGDFAIGANAAYKDDIISPSLVGGAQGLTASGDAGSQWFLDHIEIYQFYYSGGARLYDSYFLYNPRISTFEPDELDYESSAVSQVNMSIMFENVQYQSKKPSAAGFAEFAGLFDGHELPETTTGASDGSPATGSSSSGNLGGSALGDLFQAGSSLGNVLSPLLQTTAAANAAYRMADSATGGALSSFGSFNYGGGPLASLASQTMSGVGAINNISSSVGAATTQFGAAANNVASSLLATGTNLVASPAGAQLPSMAMGLLNASQGGTAQYGFNSGAASNINPSTYPQTLASNVASTLTHLL